MSDAPTEEEVIAGFHEATAKIGDNLVPYDENRHLESMMNRLENLEKEKISIKDRGKQCTAEQSEIYAEGKAKGHSPKAMRILLKRRTEDPAKRDERLSIEEEADLMEHALGQLASLPLGEAAIGSVRR